MEPGSYIRVKTHSGLDFVGTVLPGAGLVLKLDDGYNIGIDERNIKSSTVLDPKISKKVQAQTIKINSSLPKIRILHTGGTIASKVDYATGGTSNLVTPDELLALYPELQTIAQTQATFLSSMSSDDMRFSHWNIISEAVEQAIKDGMHGVIITQGTDTLHYTAAAMHYALQGVQIPVVVVGSQRSSDRGSSDAFTNLMGAARFITQAPAPGVFVGMHATTSDESIAILRGINARKMHTSRRDAFASINIPQVATVTNDQVIVHTVPPPTDAPFKRVAFDESLKVGMLLAHPHMYHEQWAVFKDFDGLVLLGTGLGHTPINDYDENTSEHKVICDELTALAQSMPIVMTSQCINGRVSLQVYSAGRKHADLGILGHDSALTPETTFCKLAYCLSVDGDAKQLFVQDMNDSIDRIEEGTYERS